MATKKKVAKKSTSIDQLVAEAKAALAKAKSNKTPVLSDKIRGIVDELSNLAYDLDDYGL